MSFCGQLRYALFYSTERFDWVWVCFISGKPCQCQHWLTLNTAVCASVCTCGSLMSDAFGFVFLSNPTLDSLPSSPRTKPGPHPPRVCSPVPWSEYWTMIAFNQQCIHQPESPPAWSSPQGIPAACSSWGGSLINEAGMHQLSERGGGMSPAEHNATLFGYLHIPLRTFPLRPPSSPESNTLSLF